MCGKLDLLGIDMCLTVPYFQAVPEMEYVVQTGSNLKEIGLAAREEYVFTPPLCVHPHSDT